MGRLVNIDYNLNANPSAPPVQHYQAYRPRPFTREQRGETTILFGRLTWKHERLMQGALHNLKYKAEPLPNIHPEARRATYKVPHKKYSRTSACYVLHLVQDLGMQPAWAKHATGPDKTVNRRTREARRSWQNH